MIVGIVRRLVTYAGIASIAAAISTATLAPDILGPPSLEYAVEVIGTAAFAGGASALALFGLVSKVISERAVLGAFVVVWVVGSLPLPVFTRIVTPQPVWLPFAMYLLVPPLYFLLTAPVVTLGIGVVIAVRADRE